MKDQNSTARAVRSGCEGAIRSSNSRNRKPISARRFGWPSYRTVHSIDHWFCGRQRDPPGPATTERPAAPTELLPRIGDMVLSDSPNRRIITFAAEWLKDANTLRPVVLIIILVMLLLHLPTVLFKLRMLCYSIVYFLLSRDKSWKQPQDPGAIFGPHLSKELPIERKTVYFVRHGESCWNEVFNKGSHRTWEEFAIGFIPGLIKAIFYEVYLLLTGRIDSWFFDSPLSHLGLAQVEELQTFIENRDASALKEAYDLKVLRGDPDAPRSKLLSSGLRRASSTMAGCFRERLHRRPDDRILVVDSLQEMSRNPDTLAITPAHSTINASWIEKHYKTCNFQGIYNNQTDMSLYSGNKSVFSNGLVRMEEFCSLIFSSDVKESHVVVGGHSIWFRSFFNIYLPFSVQHPSKCKKIVNGGVVAFDLMKADTKRGPRYMIDPKTIRVIYGGF